MSARDAMAAMLDELMGPQRNANDNKNSFSFRDESVCKFALADFCPHDLFVHTKGDLGPCSLIHDDKLRLEYQSSSDFTKLGYERRLLTFLEKLHDDMQFQIKNEKKRLQAQYGGSDKEKEQAELDAQIVKMEKEAEEAGEKGDVEEVKKCMDKIEVLRLEKSRRDKMGDLLHREMEVCEICARRLIVNDAPNRVEEHLTGKMHVGYIRIAETITRLREIVQKADAAKRSVSTGLGDGDKRRDDRHHSSRDRDRVSDHGRRRSRDRDHDRDRDRRRDRSRDHKRSRSRSRDRRDHRDRDRDRRGSRR